jgi:hypothetical protein
MKHTLLTLGLILMNSEVVIGSNDFTSVLMDERENVQVARQIVKKAGEDLNISKLAEKEKEWLYETRLLNTLNSLREQRLNNSEDLYRALGKLAEFYIYKRRPDLADERYRELAEQELINALNGSEQE